jgi:hypothetical protein
MSKSLDVCAALLVATPAGAGDAMDQNKALSMIAIIQVYHDNCGNVFRDKRDKEKFINSILPLGEATISDAYLQMDAKREKFGTEKFCSSVKPAIEGFLRRWP